MDMKNFSVAVDVDTSQLDAAIKKMEHLLALSQQVDPSDATLGVATAVAALTLSATPRRISRRSLFTFFVPKP